MARCRLDGLDLVESLDLFHPVIERNYSSLGRGSLRALQFGLCGIFHHIKNSVCASIRHRGATLNFTGGDLYCSAFRCWRRRHQAEAWGDDGHEVVAVIAEHYLTAAAKKQVDLLLAADTDPLTKHDVASEATWADTANRIQGTYHSPS